MKKPLILSGACAALCAAVLSAQTKPAATPEEAVKRLEAAIVELNKDVEKAGALDPVLAAFSDQIADAHKQMFALCPRLEEAEKKLKESLDKQFGKDSAAGVRNRMPEMSKYKQNFVDDLSGVVKLEITKKEPQGDDRVLLTLRADVKLKTAAAPAVREERHLAVRGADGWKLTPEKLHDAGRLRMLRVQVEAFKKAPETLDRVAGEVSAGKYRNREEANQAAFTAFVATLQSLNAQVK